MIAAGRLQIDPLISRTLPLEEAAEGLGAAEEVFALLEQEVPAGGTQLPPLRPTIHLDGVGVTYAGRDYPALEPTTADLPPGSPTPVVITYYQDKSFSLEFKTTPAAYLLKQAAGLPLVGKRNRAKGSSKPGRDVAGTVTVAQIRQIAETKMKDLNANSVEAAMQIILGSARSCGIEVKG